MRWEGKLYSHVRLKIQKQVQVHTSCQRISNRPERLVCNLQYARTASNKILLRRESGILVSLWTGSLIGERVEKSLFLPAFHPFFKQRLSPPPLLNRRQGAFRPFEGGVKRRRTLLSMARINLSFSVDHVYFWFFLSSGWKLPHDHVTYISEIKEQWMNVSSAVRNLPFFL